MTEINDEKIPVIGEALLELGRVSNENAVEHGFYDVRQSIVDCIIESNNTGEVKARLLREYRTQWELCRLFLIVTELAEAGEDVRKGHKEHVGEEYADVLIRLVDNAYANGIDLGEQVVRKMHINHNRPFMHGKQA